MEGQEIHLYFENSFLLFDSRRVIPDITCAKGTQQNDYWTWIPGSGEIGDHPLTLELRNEANAVVSRATTLVRVTSPKVASPSPPERSILIIGDSLTAASVYPEQILTLARKDHFPLRLLGTRGPGVEEGKPLGEVRHEGYGGWTAAKFATHFTGKAHSGPSSECGSPFLYKRNPDRPEEKPSLDFTRYFRETNMGVPPDFVTILLGCNDTFSATDETIETTLDSYLKHLDTLIVALRNACPQARIGLILPMPPAATQDAFGANYGNGQTRWQYCRNRHRVVERMTEHYRGKGKDHLDLIGAHLNLDSRYGFPSVKTPVHSHSEETIQRQSNGVHPSASGYRQIGDVVYAWLRSVPLPASNTASAPRG